MSGPPASGALWLARPRLGFAGYICGLLVLKTRSLMLPIAVHTAIDLPVYAFFACRNPLPL